jgi:hypothetical protein
MLEHVHGLTGSTLDEAELIDEIAYAAAKAGVPVEVGPPRKAA